MKRLKALIIFISRKNLLKSTDTIIIVSSGRTGTKFFEHLFKEIDNSAIVFHEPKPDLFDLGVKKIRLHRSSGTIINDIILQRGRLIEREKKRRGLVNAVYVESNPFLYPILNEFSSVFKSAKVLYITRDAKTYIVSAYNKDPQNDRINNFYGDSDKRKRLTASDFNELSQSEWEGYSREEKISWHWNKSNKMLFSYFLKNKDKSIMIRYEDLFSTSIETKKEALVKILTLASPNYNISVNIERLLKVLDHGLNKSEQLSDKANFEDFDEATKYRIEGIIEPMANKLGYLN
ncbi:MAG: sulfotransferase domain-containing protein [Aequorivita sp.]